MSHYKNDNDYAVGLILVELQNVCAGWVLFKLSPTRQHRSKMLRQLQVVLLTTPPILELQLSEGTVAAFGK